MVTLPPLPERFTAELTRSDGDRTTLYMDGWMRRLDMHPKIGPPTIVISRPDKGVIWSLDPITKTYSQAKLPTELERAFNPDSLYDWVEDGTDIIDRRKHRMFIGRYRAPEAPAGNAREVYFIDAATGMRRRVESYDRRGRLALTIEYLNAKLGKPPRTVFDMPPGYKRGYHRKDGLKANQITGSNTGEPHSQIRGRPHRSVSAFGKKQ